MLILMVLAVFIGTAFWWGLSASQDRRAHYVEEKSKELCAAATPIIAEHLDVLVRKRRILACIEEYGMRDETKWIAEAGRFVDKVLLPRLPTSLQHLHLDVSTREYVINKMVLPTISREETIRAESFATIFDKNMNPIEYEHFCAERLRLSGWRASVTQASGDQGADVIANRNNKTVILQCKHYGVPVGNKAVQEAAAALRHYGGTIAVVVAPNGFTKSARDLAATNDVMLIDHDDLLTHPRLAFDKPASELPHGVTAFPEPVYSIAPRRGWWQRTFGA